MFYSKWETEENMKNYASLKEVKESEKLERSGIPILYENGKMYIDDNLNHSLVIGSTGSGKTQVITLPMLDLIAKANESVFIQDVDGELYENTSENFKKLGYNVVKLDFENPNNSDHWNPLELPHQIYKSGNKDLVGELVEDIGFYLLNDLNNKDSDPFWINSAVSYFTGLVLYLMEKEDTVTLKKVSQLDFEVREKSTEFLNKIDKDSVVYIYLSGILSAPVETKGSIFAVFSDKIKQYLVKGNLMNMLDENDIQFDSLNKDKTVIYAVTGNNKKSEYLMPLLINQIVSSIREKDKRLNIILPEFNSINPIKNFGRILNNSRRKFIRFTVMINGFNDLKNIYGKETTDILKISFTNIIYLLSQDLDTVSEISRMCGNQDKDELLITPEQLKCLNMFEAVILMVRIMPFKTKLVPYYKQ